MTKMDLEEENRRPQEAYDAMLRDLQSSRRRVLELVEELNHVQRERDSIEREFREFLKCWWAGSSGFPCNFCKWARNGTCTKEERKRSKGICAGKHFAWRGVNLGDEHGKP